AKQELRAPQQCPVPHFDTGLEVTAIRPSLLIEGEQVLHFGRGHRATIRSARDGRKNRLRARRIVGSLGRPARKNSLAALRLADPAAGSRELNMQLILAVAREVVTEDGSATRPKRQPCQLVSLREIQRQNI